MKDISNEQDVAAIVATDLGIQILTEMIGDSLQGDAKVDIATLLSATVNNALTN